MRLTKKDAKLIFQEFVDAKQSQKSKIWDKLVPYANEYPELYDEIVRHPKKRVIKKPVKVENEQPKIFKLF